MTSRTKRTLFWTIGIILITLSLLAFVGPLIPYKERSNWICTVTGSTRTDVTWFGLFRHQERTVSYLEQWLNQREPQFQPNWQHLSTQTCYIGGGFSCGTAGTPDVYRLTYTLKEDGIRKMSDGRIAALIEVLRHGSADTRKQMIESFSDEVLQKTDGVIKD